ncbi:MAG: Uma2 family endonuclease [Cyanobacteria bacterium P01_D01_bin.14]
MTVAQDKSYSFEEYVAHLTQSEQRYELVDGSLVEMNPPTFRHLLIAKFLEKQFDAKIQSGQQPWLAFREAGVRTGLRKSRLTDVYVLHRDQVSEMLDESAICQTAPILIVEVISPDSVSRDYRHKRSEYAALGVQEYWVVDPIEEKVTVFLLSDGLYEENVFAEEAVIASRVFPNLQLSVNTVFASGNLP